MNRLAAFLVLAFAALAPLHPVRAAEPAAPIFWDAKERIVLPDLATLPRLRFLTTTDFPPFNFIDGGGRLSGFHVDLVRAICAELAIADKCQIQALPWSELEPALEKGDGEAIVAGLAATDETREKYVFTRAYLQFPARFVMRKAVAVTEPLAEKLQGRRVGVVAGSAHEGILAAYFPALKPEPFKDDAALFAALKASKVDAAFGDGMRMSFWLAGAEAGGCCRFAGGPYLAPEYIGGGLAIAVKPQDAVLAQALDYALHEIARKGTFTELYLRYFPVGFF